MIVGVGIDAVDVERFAKAMDRRGERLLQRLFNEEEQELCQRQPARLAARFAVKEAFLKACGTGLSGLRWVDLTISRDKRGAPVVLTSDRVRPLLEPLGVNRIHVSISHTAATAVAVVVLEK